MSAKQQLKGFKSRKRVRSSSESQVQERNVENQDENQYYSNCQIFRNVGISDHSDEAQMDEQINDGSEQATDGHDDYCFGCSQDGEMLCCDDCHRAYHHGCISKPYRQIGKRWVCEHCHIRLNSLCKICGDKTEQLEQDVEMSMVVNSEVMAPKEGNIPPISKVILLTCSLCYCRVHSNCINLPLALLRSRNYILEGYNNYLCPGCFDKTKQFRIIYSQKFLQTEELLYHFINAVSDSPIHCCWISDSELVERKNLSKNKFITCSKSEQASKCRIEKVISLRQPAVLHSVISHREILEQLKNRILNNSSKPQYAGSNNFRFLVKWKNSVNFVWEDESVVRRFPFQLKKFLSYSLFAEFYIDENPLSLETIFNSLITKQDYENFQKSLGPRKKPAPVLHIRFDPSEPTCYENLPRNNKKSTDKISYLTKLIKREKTAEIIDATNAHQNFPGIFSKVIGNIYEEIQSQAEIILPPITIIITESTEICKWEDQLNRNCPKLEQLVMTEGMDLEQTKSKDFLFKYLFYPKFQVLLISYDILLMDWKFIQARINRFHCNFLAPKTEPPASNLILFDSFQRDFLQFADVRFPETSKIVILNKTKDPWLALQFHSHFPDFEAFKFSFEAMHQRQCAFKVTKDDNGRNQVSKRTFNHSNVYSMNLNWKLDKRICFHLYILAFGFNEVRGPRQLMTRLNVEYPEAFPWQKDEKKRNSSVQQFQEYVNLFLNLIKDWKAVELAKNIDKDDFLFHLQREQVLKRVCQLAKMKSAVQFHANEPKNFPFKIPLKLFVGKEISHLKSWKGLHDYTLCACIIRYGFGNWGDILDDVSIWVKYISTNLRKGSSFGSYLAELVRSKRNDKSIDIKQIIEERSYYCLKLMN